MEAKNVLTGKVSTLPVVDKTLTRAGYSADAKATGDAIAENEKKIDVESAELHEELDVERAERKKEIAVERARIDTFTVLSEGSTTGDAELADIRVGADGKTYANAGDALRGQVSSLKSDLSNIEKLNGYHYSGKSQGNDIYPFVDTNINITQGEKLYIRLNNCTGDFNYLMILDADTQANIAFVYTNSTQFGEIISCEALTHSSNVRFVFLQNTPITEPIDVDIDFVKLDSFTPALIEKRTNELNRDVQVFNQINDFVGADSEGLKIDNINKTFTMCRGIWIPRYGDYIYLADDVTINYSDFVVDTNLLIIDLVWDKPTNNLLIRKHTQDASGNYVFIFSIFLYDTSWAFDEKRIYYSNEYIKGITQFNGVSTDKLEFNTNIHTARIFKKVVCCGDSYTEGYIVDSNGVVHPSMKDYSWVNYMAKSTGNNWVNCGVSGATSVSYQSHDGGLSYALSQGKTQAYVIGLMINDMVYGVPVGTVADIGTENQTYYGAMSKLIRTLHDKSPSAFIFVNTIPQKLSDYVPYNEAVRVICNQYKDTYNTHCIDLESYYDLYQNSSLIDDANNGHYSAVGYEQFAEIYEYILSDYINKEPLVFQDVPFIDYDN